VLAYAPLEHAAVPPLRRELVEQPRI